ncbi:MAG: 4Fe-4S dicluster domain-containing protein [Verrucomicrobia bacterium]|nr:MAG: 4Fe-4S dicluster domain-containing protein [Verrucomicrobiota bacterium]
MPVDLTFAEQAVARVGRKPDAVIPILQALQEHYGYLPEEALRRVCETSDITPAAIAGVASFYDMFRFSPTGKHVVRVCRGTACHVAGAERVEDALRRHLQIPTGGDTDRERQFTIEQVACLGTCTLAPTVKIGEATFGHTSAERVPEVMRDFLALQTEARTTQTTEATPDSDNRQSAIGYRQSVIHVGLGSCCMAKGSDKLFHALNASAAQCGGSVVVKRVGCVGMCHRTPMIEVAEAGGGGKFYADLTAAQAQALVQRHFKPRGFVQRAGRIWTRVLDGLLLDDKPEEQSVQRFSMSKRDPNVREFLDRQVHIATEHFGKLDPLDLDEYLAHGGFEALAKCVGANPNELFSLTPALSRWERENRSQVLEKSGAGVSSADSEQSTNGQSLFPLPGGEGQGEGVRQNKSEISQSLLTSAATSEQIISTIEKSGLRGRGGAGFPTGQKWRVVSQQASETKYVICNGDEGDPGAFMDRMILESFPFRVIEGLMIAAVAVGASEGIFYIRHEYPLAVRRVRAAIAELEKRGWLASGQGSSGRESAHSSAGEIGADSRPLLRMRVFEGAGAFVCGEETALIASVEGQRGMPKLRPPFPAREGLWGKPTLINNVETLAMVPWILRNGAEKFAAIGTAKSKGTKVFALAGKIRRGGLIEIPMGTTIREIVEEIGGGVGDGRKFKAVQIGGPSGGCVPARLADTPVDYESLRDVGAIMGSGGLVVLDDTSCMVDIARYFLQFTQDQSCGKCTFCRIGTKRMLDLLDRFCTGKATKQHLEDLERLAHQVGAGSLCGLGKTAPNPVLTTLKYFRDEYEAHLQGRCPAKKCSPLIHYTINTDCTGCTICAQHCPVNAIPMTPYTRHVIDDAKCTRCDTCRVVCPHNAVEVR